MQPPDPQEEQAVFRAEVEPAETALPEADPGFDRIHQLDRVEADALLEDGVDVSHVGDRG
jgi:hypothetical protein